jgi:hypothetical protein
MLLRFLNIVEEEASYLLTQAPTLLTATPLAVVHASAMPAAVVAGGLVNVGTG